MAKQNPKSKAGIISAYVNKNGPLASGAVHQAIGDKLEFKNPDETSRTLAGCWKNHHIGRIPNTTEASGQYLYCSKEYPGALLYEKPKRNGTTVTGAAGIEIPLDSIPDRLSPAKPTGLKPGPKPRVNNDEIKAVLGELIVSTAEALLRRMR